MFQIKTYASRLIIYYIVLSNALHTCLNYMGRDIYLRIGLDQWVIGWGFIYLHTWDK